MSEMIQRVAKAILEAENPDASDQYTDMARAAIEAMREPTLGMLRAGPRPGECFHPVHDENVREEIWQAMIDAALSRCP